MIIFLVFLLCFSDTGVVIVDNVWFYGDDHKIRVLETGDLVEIIELHEDTVKIKYDNAVGVILKGVLIDFKENIAEDELFVFARGYFDDGKYWNAVSLFDAFIRFFDESEYYAEVLYYHGLSYEALARHLNSPDSIPGVLFNEHYNICYYSGESYMTILEDYAESMYASKAAYCLFNIFRTSNQPWRDSIQLIQAELKMWQDFAVKYKNTDEYVLALLEIGYLNRVLFEITEDSDYRTDAAKVFQEILDKYPNSINSAQSKVNLHEIENRKKIYKY